jgi:hypothetical protein
MPTALASTMARVAMVRRIDFVGGADQDLPIFKQALGKNIP